jgi:hypothetical protein
MRMEQKIQFLRENPVSNHTFSYKIQIYWLQIEPGPSRIEIYEFTPYPEDGRI